MLLKLHTVQTALLLFFNNSVSQVVARNPKMVHRKYIYREKMLGLVWSKLGQSSEVFLHCSVPELCHLLLVVHTANVHALKFVPSVLLHIVEADESKRSTFNGCFIHIVGYYTECCFTIVTQLRNDE